MGRKSRNSAGDVENFSVTKEKSLEVFEKKTQSISKDVVAKFGIKPVGKLNMVTGHIRHFNEKNYEESLKEAYAWAERMNKAGIKVELLNYFPQEFMNKMIFVGYKIKGEL